MEETRKLCLCDECGEDIFEDNPNIFIDPEGNVFCSLECALLYYGIHRPTDDIMC